MKKHSGHLNEAPVDLHVRQNKVAAYGDFYYRALDLLQIESNRCLFYVGEAREQFLDLYCGILDPREQVLHLFSLSLGIQMRSNELPSLSAWCPSMHAFEVRITHTTGLRFTGAIENPEFLN